MPQMFPMNWLYLYIFSYISILISNNYMYFNFKINMCMKLNNMMNNTNKLYIKW